MLGTFVLKQHKSDPKQDKLIWCFAAPNQSRPKEFSIAAGKNRTFVELDRFHNPETKIVSELKVLRVMHRRIKDWVVDVGIYGDTNVIKALSLIRGLRKLERLSVSKITDDAAQLLDGHSELVKLKIGGELSKESWSTIASLPKLAALQIRDSSFNIEAGAAFQNSSSLESMTFTTVKGFGGLTRLNKQRIKELEFCNCSLSEVELSSIAENFTELRRLTFRNTKISTTAKVRLRHLNLEFK